MNKEDKAYQDGYEDSEKNGDMALQIKHYRIAELEKEIELLKDSDKRTEIERTHEWLDDRGVPRSKGDDEYTILSRMQILYSCEVN